MKSHRITFSVLLSVICLTQAAIGAERFVSLSGAHQPPFTSWADAATNIQSAIDAASAGDTVWVTNGIYSAGGKIMGGDLLNRIALDKAIVVQSVNGPNATVVQGNWDTTTNGPLAVRCAWLTNGASLKGFTLQNGATRGLTAFPNQQMNGGGVWCASSNSLLMNCIITNNACSFNGGGVYQGMLSNCIIANNCVVGTPGSVVASPFGLSGDGGGVINAVLRNCFITGNSANNNGGGTANCNLNNCALTGNSSYLFGAAAYRGGLLNCTVTGNTSGGYGTQGAAVANVGMTNCIVVSNLARSSIVVGTNYYNVTAAYSCLFPSAPGEGNISSDPQLLSDGIHVSSSSTCRGAGTNVVNGVDIDGQSWSNPPSIGCDEWRPEPVVIREPKFQVRGFPTRLYMTDGAFGGQEPIAVSWQKDGVLLEDGSHYNSSDSVGLIVNNFGPADAGDYQLVASNAFGMATSAVVRVVVHCADANSSSPVPPFSSWATAAATIQEAIDAAQKTDIVLVTNGIYAEGGKVISGDLLNRVALTKSQTVISVNGPEATIIQGAWDANTNGPAAVRCAWLTNGAVLNGFTLQSGATRTNGDATLQNGGGVWGTSTQAVVMNCWIYTNSAAGDGGGSFQTALTRCKVVGNRATNGGGVARGSMNSSFVAQNVAGTYGGGAYECDLNHCTIVENETPSLGGGAYAMNATTRNSIFSGNNFPSSFSTGQYYGSSFNINYCCSDTPFPIPGIGNLSAVPQFTDQYHLAVTSPCRGAGSAFYASDTDIDGEPWANPPSMGCDEVFELAINGPLSVRLNKQWDEVAEGRPLYLFSTVTGRVTRAAWSFGDGSVLTNVTEMSVVHLWTNAGDYTVTFTAYNNDNTNGVSASTTVRVVPLITPEFSSFIRDGTNFTVGFMPQPSVTYYLERATNLAPPVSWQTVGAVYGVSNYVEVVDATATNATQFYRVRIR